MKQKPPLPDRLRSIVNLKAFAEAAGLHRRTLQRVMSDTDSTPNAATVALIEQRLAEIKPEMRKAPK